MPVRILSIALVLIIVTSSALLLRQEQERRLVKSDFVEVSKAKYGLFNIDVWKIKISEIVANKIDEFQFDPKNKKELVKKIERFLYDGVDILETSYKSQQYSSVTHFFQNALASSIDVFDRIRENVPSIALDIVEDLEKPETRAKIKEFIKVKIDKYADETFAQVDYTELNLILSKYGKRDLEEVKQYLSELDFEYARNSRVYKYSIYLCVLLFSVMLLVGKNVSNFQLVAGLLTSLDLLFLGLFLPMIDIDARISQFDLVVLGEHVDFQNQVLYFKSKSILEVVGLMMSQGQVDILIVGFLILTFSVLFPVTKLIVSLGLLLGKLRSPSRLASFIVFRSGKWSMADVLVVAIFMAYVGFSSILSEQLSQLDKLSGSLEVLTTNKSELNTGFFMFFAFVCLSLIVSDKTKAILEK